MDSHDHKGEYYFNTRTHAVEHGRQSDWEYLLGPYATPEEAAKALLTAKNRSKTWDEDDREWRGER